MKTMKRGLAAVLAVLLLVSALPGAALAADMPSDTGTGEPYLAELGVWIGGEYVAAQAETPAIQPMSLLPLESRSYTLDLTGYLPSELQAVRLDAVVAGLTGYEPVADPSEVAVWAKGYNSDEYQLVTDDLLLDLRPEDGYDSNTDLELIIGTPDQLDPDNVRYQVTVHVTPADEVLEFQLYSAEEPRQPITVYSQYWPERSDGAGLEYGLRVDPEAWSYGDLAYLGLGLSEPFRNAGLTATVYAGAYGTGDDAEIITDEIWEPADLATAGGYLGDYQYDPDNLQQFTVVLRRNGAVAEVLPFQLYLSRASSDVFLERLYQAESTQYDIVQSTRFDWDMDTQCQERVLTLDPGYDAAGTYCVQFNYSNYRPDGPDGVDGIAFAAVGLYASQAEAEADGAADIKEALFETGYAAQFHNGVTFTIFDLDGDVYRYRITTVAQEEELPPAPEPLSDDTYFHARGAEDVGAYVMSSGDDSYYYDSGYQTVFLLGQDGAPVTASTIRPTFYRGPEVHVYAGTDVTSGTPQESGVTEIPFSSGDYIKYSAGSESGTHLKNYFVTFLTQQTGPTLFVNGANVTEHYDEETGLPVRRLMLDEAHRYYHDIFFANIGDEPLTGLEVTLSDDAQNVQLDAYWTVRGDSVGSLAPFDSVLNGAMDNIAKIRLTAPEGAVGPIHGTLTIRADGEGNEVTILLTGIAGIPEITTEEIVDGVKYVPYASVIQTNSTADADAILFERVDGSLPDGIELRPNGELYGAPLETGTFDFTVRATYEGNAEISDTAELSITILENTDANVDASTDVGYELTTRVPAAITSYEDYVFESSGELGEFQDFWLDGVRLEKDVDYIAEEGSTKITIRAQTFASAGRGTHTIAAEFRVNNDVHAELKKAAQNYTSNVSSGTSAGGSRPSTPSYAVSAADGITHGTVALNPTRAEAGETVTITLRPDAGYQVQSVTVTDRRGSAVPVTKVSDTQYTFTMPAGSVTVDARFTAVVAPAQGQPFLDVPEDAWFVEAVTYVYEQELMDGTSALTFSPERSTSRGMMVTILYRMEGQPDVGENTFVDVNPGQYYASAVAWAAENGIVEGYGNNRFGPEDPLTREQMAILMQNYAAYRGCDVTAQADLSVFVDADAVSAGAREALAWANAVGLLSGKGGGVMDPKGTATRAEAAAIIMRFHRLIAAAQEG